jgi:hypothetical protein
VSAAQTHTTADVSSFDPLYLNNWDAGHTPVRILPIQAAETRLENGDLIFSFGGGAGAHFYRVLSGE